MEESTRKHLIQNGQFMKHSPEYEEQKAKRHLGGGNEFMKDAHTMILYSPEEKKKKIETLAIGLFERSTGFRFKADLSQEKKEKLFATPAFQEYIDKATKIIEDREDKKEKLTSGKKYPVIHVPANGRPDWVKGARTMCFVYSRNHGNFILEGYKGEVEEYLKKYYTHYFCYYSMWHMGQSRGTWDFWKDQVGIFEPSKRGKSWKWEVRHYSFGNPDPNAPTFQFKRLPHRWIPEFDQF